MKPTPPNPYFALGLIAGLALGVCFGISMGNVAYGMPIGALLGVIFGAIMSRANNDQQQPASDDAAPLCSDFLRSSRSAPKSNERNYRRQRSINFVHP